MRRRSIASDQPAKSRRRKTRALKRRNARKAKQAPGPSASSTEAKIAQLIRERDDAFEQQRAAAEVLRIISASPTEFRPVLEVIVNRAAQFCDADDVTIFELDGQDLCSAAHRGPVPHKIDLRFPCTRGSVAGRSVIDRKAIHVIDLQAEADEFPEGSAFAKRFGHRTIASVPLLREGVAIGTIGLRRAEVNPFTDKQIELLEIFAAQAVIAIENARLFNEVQTRTRELSEALTYQTGSANILNVIASSPTDVAPVLKAIVESACELCGAYDAVALLKEGDYLLFGAHHGPIPIEMGRLLISRSWTPGLAVIEQKPVHIHDLLSSEGDQVPEAQQRAREFGYRTIVSVPMLREKESIGVLALRRAEAHPFSDKQIALLQTFADQAVIAIGNVRLFEEVQQRTRELSKSLDDLRAAQDRLIQTEKLASLGQLTAGIAHEIKNPLNFVNNFAALSVDLTDELKGALKPAVLDQTLRADVDEITGLLKDNLGKVVQHGKRADSIVKNMLLHSREGSGERRSADINALVRESLNLAYHGARAEKAGFEITLKHDLDPNAGALELYPQEMIRAFLNLISNGFYATNKRKVETCDEAFEPILSAATKNLGKTVEIRIRDNGTGIPPEVREKMFNPFFTTKPTGEGTGLGLSMTHDIIVKQHGGRIDVETEPGVFTEFIITLPRDNGTIVSQKLE